MMAHKSRGIFALGVTLALLAAGLTPVASAQSGLNVTSVGEIFVDAKGQASGSNLATTVVEASGVLESFTSFALDAEIFQNVRIDGFAQAQKIQGVGSSTLTLRGSNAVLTIYDNIHTEFKIEATQDTSVHYDLGSEVRAAVNGATGHHATVVSETGAYLGSVVLVGADGAASASERIRADAEGNLHANLDAGSQLVWRARPVYVQSDAYVHAVVDALAAGDLAAQVVTEFSGNAETQSKVDYQSAVRTHTRTVAKGVVETTVKAQARASTLVSYDFAYETLGAASAKDVAVYANGNLAARAESAAQVREYAEAGLASYYAVTANGRTQLLASTPDFEGTAEHKLSVVAQTTAKAKAQSETQARAASKADAQSRVHGQFDLHATGKVTGTFATAILNQVDARLEHFTSLDARTEVFSRIQLAGEASGDAAAETEERVQVESSEARLTLVDDLYATLLVEAKSHTEATFDVAADVKARAESDNVVRLDGPNGFAGTMILARADGQAAASSRFVTDASGDVRAELEQGARVVFRQSADARAHASEDVVAKAIAEGRLGAQVLAGFEGETVTASDVEYYGNVAAEVTAAAKGRFDIDYQSEAQGAASFVFDSRGTALAAKSASDINVLVNGQAAAAVGSAEAALSASGRAAYFVDTTLSGATRVLVNTGAEAAASAKVTIESKVDAAARAAANADAFGSFKIFYDGTTIGNFVSLKTDTQAGVVNDFTMASTGETIFSSIAAGASSFVSAGADGSSQLLLENEETQLEFSDTTSAFTKIVAKQNTDVWFQLASEVQAEARSRNVLELTTSTGEHVGSMIITNVEGQAAAASRFEADAEGAVRAQLEQGAQILFRTHVGIETELSAAQRTMINHAIAGGQLGGQILVQTQAALAAKAHAAAQAKAQLEATAYTSGQVAGELGSTLVSQAEASGRVTTAITASYYNDVQMVTAATQNRVDVTVSSTTSAGKTILVSLDPGTLSAMAEGNAEILVDGKVVTQASSYADILNPNDDAGADEYFVLTGEAGTQVLVSLAHFSTRTVTLKEPDAEQHSVFMYATIFLGVLVVAETAVLVRRRFN